MVRWRWIWIRVVVDGWMDGWEFSFLACLFSSRMVIWMDGWMALGWIVNTTMDDGCPLLRAK